MKVEWLHSLPDMRVPGVPGVPSQKTVGFAGTRADVCGVPGVPEHEQEHAGTRTGTQKNTDKILKNNKEHAEHQEHAIKKGGAVFLREWDKGVGSLDLDTPLGGYPRDQWKRIVRDCDRLLNEFGRGAATMGWTTEDLFSFPVGGAASDDLGGLIWRLDGGRVVFMDEVRAAYRWPFSDRTSRFARGHIGALSGHRVPVWELAA